MTQFTESTQITVSLSEDKTEVLFFRDSISWGEWTVDLIDKLPVSECVNLDKDFLRYDQMIQTRIAKSVRGMRILRGV